MQLSFSNSFQNFISLAVGSSIKRTGSMGGGGRKEHVKLKAYIRHNSFFAGFLQNRNKVSYSDSQNYAFTEGPGLERLCTYRERRI